MVYKTLNKAPSGALLTCTLFSLLIFISSTLEININLYFYVLLPAIFGALIEHYSNIKKEIREIEKYSLKEKILSVILFNLLLSITPNIINYFSGIYNPSFYLGDQIFLTPILFLLSPFLVIYIEHNSPQKKDDYWKLGHDILAIKAKINDHKKIILSWAVRIFFIPLIYSWLFISVKNLLDYQWEINPLSIVLGIFQFGLCIDLLMAFCGYVFSSRIFGNKVISTDATWSGWFVCLICYPPLIFILHAAKKQTDDLIWSDWLTMHDGWLYWLWCAIICGTWGVYFWSSINMGFKFSNLSWRGLVDHGAYRYVKHPAYLSKNIYWWAHTVPFVGVASTLDFLRNIAGLAFVSLIYYLRAKTEERHLMQFAEYRAYSAHMAEHGLWARLQRLWRPRG